MTTATDEKLGRVIPSGKKPDGPAKMSRGQRTFVDFVTATNHWANDHATKVTKLFILPEEDGIRLFLVGRSEEYDFGLSKELADFVRMWSKRIPVVPMLIPACTKDELTAYFDPDAALGFLVG